MGNRILINREECEIRVAFMEDQKLVELHSEKFDDHTIVNNIYRGKVQDVVPGLQAAFVDVGLNRNMFLHFMDIRSEALVLGSGNQVEAMRKASEKVMPGRIERKGRRPRQDPNAPQAAAPVKKGDPIIVQVVKDEIGGKAPRVTTNLSLAGRYLVMLPFPSQDGGVSRKIALGQDRIRLKRLLAELKTPDYSFIVRTAGIDQQEEAIRKDAEALAHTWQTILKRYKQLNGPGLVNNDHDLIARLVRDAFPSEFDEVICDDAADAEEVRFHLHEVLPEMAAKVRLYEGTDNLFERQGVEKEIEKSMARKIWLKSGGYLIIDENEALTAIDVNTGRFTGKKDQEKTSLKTNQEAAEVIAEQIRLRDIGGIIVIDFIDMLSRAHQERVSEDMRRYLRNDRAKTAIGRIGDFGLMMLTRKRQRMSLQNHLFDECPYCTGTGLVKNNDEIFRSLKYDIRKVLANDKTIHSIVVSGNVRFIESLRTRFARFIHNLSEEHHCSLVLREDADIHVEDYQLTPVKGTERRAPRVTAERVTEQSRILPAIHEAGPAARSEKPAEVLPVSAAYEPYEEREELEDEEEADDIEAVPAPPAAALKTAAAASKAPAVAANTAAPPAPGSDAEQQETRKRRRRRESSYERRLRRKKARDFETAPGAAAAQSPARDAAMHDLDDLHGDMLVPLMDSIESPRVGSLPALELEKEPRASLTEKELKQPVYIMLPPEQQPEAEAEPGAKKKTRRGRRGGRGRSRRGREGDGAPQSGEQHKAAQPPAPLPPLKLATSASTRKSEVLASVLDKIEQKLETLKSNPEVAAAEAAASAAARRPSTSRRRRLADASGNGDDEAILPEIASPGDDFEPVDQSDDVPLTKAARSRKVRPKRKPAPASAPTPQVATPAAPARRKSTGRKAAEETKPVRQRKPRPRTTGA